MSVFMRRLLSNSPDRFCFSRVSWEGGSDLKVTDFQMPFQRHTIVGYCNGLFCLDYDNKIIIFNPSNQTYQQLSYPTHDIFPDCPFEYCRKPCSDHTSCIQHTSIVVCGFGQDLKTNEFKVVTQVITYFDAGGTYDGLFNQIYVCTLGKIDDGWTKFQYPQTICFTGGFDYGTWVKGCCYWMCHEPTNDENGYFIPVWSIIKLDLGTLEFSRIESPKEVSYFMRPSFVVMELEDSLGLIMYSIDDPKTVHTWWFGEDEWVTKYTSPTFSFDEVECEKVLGYLNDTMVLEGLDSSHLLMYDCALNKVWKSDLIRDLPSCMRLFPFFESSVELEVPYFSGCDHV